jgi:hypothetical protein
LTDLYAFPKPGDPDKSILVMNVHPSVGLNPPGPTTAEPFAPEARYELKIDTDGDAVANISYEVRFSSFQGGEQRATLRRVEGAQAAETGGDGKVIVEGVPVSTGHGHMWRRLVTTGSLPVGAAILSSSTSWARSPIPVYRSGFLRRQKYLQLVLEVPNSFLGRRVGHGLALIPADSAGGAGSKRIAGAAQQTPFLAGEQNDAYLAGQPANDDRFRSYVRARPGTRGRVFTGGSRSGWRENCCRTFCGMTPNAPRPSQTTAAGSSTTFLTSSSLFSPTGR